MRKNPHRLVVLLIATLAIAALTGCAKKQAPVPVAPPPAPTTPTTPAPAPVETPKPVETPSGPIQEADFQPAFFDFELSALRGDARAALDADAKLLRDHPGTKVLIEGHCDERGTVEYNMALGDQRANAARDYLVSQGIDAGRMQTVSYGKERPFATGHDESSWQQNRRAHFRIAK